MRERWVAELDVDAGAARAPARERHDAPFCLLLVGDFGGHASSGATAPLADRTQDMGPGPRDTPGLGERRPVPIDRDDFDDVLARMAPRLRLAFEEADAAPVEAAFASLDDFHPDALFEALPAFRSLRELRARLNDASTWRLADAELRGWTAGAAADSPAVPGAPAGGGALLEQMLDSAADQPGAATPPRDDFYDFLQQIVRPHLAPSEDPDRARRVAEVDAATSAHMRAVLHHPAFQELEALWRAVFLLVRRIETSGSLRIYLLDATREELAADLTGAPPAETGLARVLAAAPPGAGDATWSLVAAGYTFAADDAAVLRPLASLAAALDAPVVVAAAPSLVGLATFAIRPEQFDAAPVHAGWDALRRAPEAAWLGLAAPRFLARLPYGAAGEECEAFAFEEMAAPPRHDDLLWANPAFLVALMIGRAFAAAGPALRRALDPEIGGLPLYLIREETGAVAQPCAEILLTESAAERMLDRGVMPVASMKDQDAVRLVRLQSVAAPAAALAGPWSTPET